MKHRFVSKRYWKDQQTPMGKVDELAKNYNDVINLSLGDPDLTTHELIIRKSFEDASAGHTKYTDFRGDPELRAEICKYYKDMFGMTVKDEEVFVSASGCLAMYLALEAILDDGDEVILQAPFFTPYPQQVELARGIPVELPTYEEEDFQINIERLESLISYQHPFVPFASLPGMQERTIIINSFSKDYTMTGWRVGNIIAPECIIKTVQQINENVVFTAPSISQRAALHGMRNRQIVQPEMVEEYRKRVYYAAERINEIPNMHVLYPPKGTFYLFVNIKDTGLDSVDVSDIILREAHVLTIPGIAFGNCGEGYIRLACTVNVDTLKEAFDRIGKVSIFQK